ncbi:hypothetical protein HPP92_002603 [Vanilla planifolia]|uniref:Uncharacterized protein n=1 Tax=Vanilla planifolia TaxID=51239 RepID=A0A835S6M9_VANPL|nr:hypothetical protein HPP92_002603 [Vanilla planifolia]
MGASCGIYVAQNYDVPDMRKLFLMGIGMARQYEEIYRKPKKKPESNNASLDRGEQVKISIDCLTEIDAEGFVLINLAAELGALAVHQPKQ